MPRLVAAQRRLPHSQKPAQRLHILHVFRQVLPLRCFEDFGNFPETPVAHDEAKRIEPDLPFPDVLVAIDA